LPWLLARRKKKLLHQHRHQSSHQLQKLRLLPLLSSLLKPLLRLPSLLLRPLRTLLLPLRRLLRLPTLPHRLLSN